MEKERLCINCGKPLYGRPDKMFCCERCKTNWHNFRKGLIRRSRSSVLTLLENNHSILVCLMNSGCLSWPLRMVESLGFKRDYLTRLAAQNRGEMVCECFDIRYRVSKTKIWGLEKIGSPGGASYQINSPSRS